MHKRILLAALLAAAVVVRPAHATLTSTCSSSTQVGNGSTTAFTFACKFLQNSDISVTVNGVGKTQPGDYTVSGAGNASGTVTFGTAPASGAIVIITRTVDLKQSTSLRQNRSLDPGTVETTLDKLTMQVQQVDAKAPTGSGGVATQAYVDAAVTATLSGGMVVSPLSWSLTGDGVTTAYSIPNAAVSNADLYTVTIDGLLQKPTTDYTVSVLNGQITFASAPALNAAISVRSLGYARALSVFTPYQCNSTGCVARPTSDKIGDFMSVEDFGADPTGVADSTTAIQKAVNAAYATKTALYMHQGRYRVTAPITLTASGSAGNQRGLLIFGDAPSPRMDRIYFQPTTGFTIIDASGTLGTWPAGRSMFEFTNLHNVTLKNLWFLGNNGQNRNDATATTNGVEFIGSTIGHHIEGCTFQMHRRGLNLGLTGGPVAYSIFLDNVFTQNWFQGAYQNGGDTQWIGNFFNEGKPADQSATDQIGVGLFLDQSRATSVIGGKIEWNSKGIQLNNASDILITGLLTDKNTYSIVGQFDGSVNKWAGKGIVITGNKFLASGGSMLPNTSQHIYFNSTNSPKVTATVSGNSFCKGSIDAYCENDGTYSGITQPGAPAHASVAGTLVAGTYYYRVSGVSALGETVATAEVSHVLAGTGGVQLTWAASAGSVTSYKVYGRTTGTEQFIAAVTAPTVTYTDTGSITPAGDTPPSITPDDFFVAVGSSATDVITFNGNQAEGGGVRGWVYVDGAAGSRLTMQGNSGAPLPQPQTNVAYTGDVPFFTAAPTAGTWRLGDLVYNKNVAASGQGPLGWVNVVAGTPGTWNSFGPIQPSLTTLSAGTATAPVFSGCRPLCTNTSNANAIKCSVSGGTLTFTGTGTDVISFVCF